MVLPRDADKPLIVIFDEPAYFFAVGQFHAHRNLRLNQMLEVSHLFEGLFGRSRMFGFGFSHVSYSFSTTLALRPPNQMKTPCGRCGARPSALPPSFRSAFSARTASSGERQSRFKFQFISSAKLPVAALPAPVVPSPVCVCARNRSRASNRREVSREGPLHSTHCALSPAIADCSM